MTVNQIQYQIDLLTEERNGQPAKYHADYNKGIKLLQRGMVKQAKLEKELQEVVEQLDRDYFSWCKS